MPSMVASYVHADAVTDSTLDRVGEALGVYTRALEDGIDKFLPGWAVQSVMRRFKRMVAR
jgi:glutamate-1-semialdehyde 2,1-aminomutase